MDGAGGPPDLIVGPPGWDCFRLLHKYPNGPGLRALYNLSQNAQVKPGATPVRESDEGLWPDPENRDNKRRWVASAVIPGLTEGEVLLVHMGLHPNKKEAEAWQDMCAFLDPADGFTHYHACRYITGQVKRALDEHIYKQTNLPKERKDELVKRGVDQAILSGSPIAEVPRNVVH